MKKHLFFPTFFAATLISIALFTGCHDRDTELPKTAETATVADPAPGDGDHQLTGRVPCVDGTECTVTVSANTGTASMTICGMNDGSSSCFISNSCGEFGPTEESYNSVTSATFCVTKERRIWITNNGTDTLDINVSAVGGSTSVDLTIPPNGEDGVEFDSGCDPTGC